MTDQLPLQPVRKKSYTVGRSYDTTSGTVVFMTTRNENTDVTMATVNTEAGVIGGGPPVPICEVKTQNSSCQSLTSICDIACETEGRMARTLDLGGGVVSVKSSQFSLLPNKSSSEQPNQSSGPGRKSPSPATVVC